MRALDIDASLGGWAGLISREHMRSPTNESKVSAVSQGFQSPKFWALHRKPEAAPQSQKGPRKSPWMIGKMMVNYGIPGKSFHWSPGNWGFPQPFSWQVAAMYFGSYRKSGHCASSHWSQLQMGTYGLRNEAWTIWLQLREKIEYINTAGHHILFRTFEANLFGRIPA